MRQGKMQQRFAPVATAWLLLGVTASAGAFELRSTDVSEGGRLTKMQVYSGFGCSGDNLSPALSWTRAPAGTRSFALTVYDPDAPTGSGWWHWIVYDLPPTTTSLPRGIGQAAGLPEGAIEARNDFGARSFGGACPPAGDKPHRYVFTIHALKVNKLDLPLDASAALVGFMINANQIGKASITARYRR
jgi:Raf kinase inhibitor-like YbhB/YbcL family protein